MPKDKRIFINLAVDMDRNPKYVNLTDGQKWLIVKAIMHCREYPNDGFLPLPVWIKMGTKRNRISVESCGAITIDEAKNVAIVHDYCEHNQTIAEIEKARESKITAGQKGGQARAANRAAQAEAEAERVAAAKQNLKQNQAEIEIDLLTNVSRSKDLPDSPANAKPKRNGYTPEFEEWWKIYPRGEAKGAAFKAYENARRQVGTQRLLEAVRGYAADPNLPEQTFIPYAQKWLNEQRYADGPLAPRSQARDSRYGNSSIPCHPNGVPLTPAEIKFAQGEARKDFPNAQLLQLAGIPLSDKQRRNLGMIPASDNLVIEAEPPVSRLLAPPARATA
ncbi:hypothetical protein ACIGKR_12320 [Rhodococcus qingshengii]|uniref:hypothetical protein n=1 Tax=Rhodococcus qingshengii TaxID=334542 RepID=UPI0037CB324B